MRPLYLHLVNVGPFCDEKIDFAALDDMFLVYGKTGSGKTTIFDAITYALYGDLCGSRKKMAANFVSDFAKPDEKSFVQFVFELYNCKYRITRSLPAVNSGGKRSAVELVFEKARDIGSSGKTGQEFERVEGLLSELNKKIESLIGLSINEFTRIVLLPQGAFAQFLKEGSNNRRETLSRLFPIDSYIKIMEMAKEKAAVFREKQKYLEMQSAELYKTLDAEKAAAEFSELSGEIEILEKERSEIFSRIEKKSAETENLRQKLEISENAAKLKEEFLNLEAKKDRIKEFEKRLRSSDKAEKLFVFIDRTRSAEEKKSASENNFYKAEKRLEAEKKNYEALEAEKNDIAALKKDMESGGKRKKEFEDRMEIILNLAAAKKRRNEALAEKESSENSVLNKKDDIRRLESDLIFAFGDSGLGPVSPENSVSENPIKFDADEVVMQFFHAAETAKSESAAAGKTLEAVKDLAQIQKKIDDAKTDTEQNQKSVSENKRLLENAKKCMDDFVAQKEIQEKNNYALALVPFLEAGKPCPVCGSIEHPKPAVVLPESLDIAEKILSQKKFIEKIEIENLELEKKSSSLKVLLKALTEQYEQSRKELQPDYENIPSYDEALAAFEAANKKSSDMIAFYEKASAICSDIRRNKKQLDELKASAAEFSKTFALFDGEVSALERQISADKNISEGAEGKSGFRGEKDETALLLESEDLKLSIKNIEEKLINDEKIVSSFEENFSNALENFASAKTSFEELKKVVCQAKKEYDEAFLAQNENILKSDFDSAEHVVSFILPLPQKEEIQKEVDRWKTDMHSAEVRLEDLKNAPDPEELKKSLDAAKKDLDDLRNSYNAFDDDIRKKTEQKTNLESVIKKSVDLEEERVKLLQEGAHYIRLSDDLEGHGSNIKKIPFDAWVLGMYFAEVVHNANPRFERISGGRYRFKIQESSGGNAFKGLDLAVFDSFTGRDRDTATLSGGETFMASISLALALTDVVQEQSGGIRLDSLFIDEGFGSLDGESLDMAVSILQNIGESRMVGIVSHVESLLQAIPSHLEVVKTADGSHIKSAHPF
ncbi:AAA family ATPase [Treponema parvum]|uniref:AAA family ATPase n=1 Tax=Treponema parvum TaxID=138851 RepID=A0A975F4T7_9SPIR|nr:AAA family ATPase [Treponema parvum]QTQ14253.1 AAA family ATPase [Treponema parvum]